MGSLAAAKPASCALAVCDGTMVAALAMVLDESDWAGVAARAAEPEVGDGPAGAGLSGVELTALGPLDLGDADCVTFAGPISGARLLSLT